MFADSLVDTLLHITVKAMEKTRLTSSGGFEVMWLLARLPPNFPPQLLLPTATVKKQLSHRFNLM